MRYTIEFWEQTWPPSPDGDARRWDIRIREATTKEKDAIMKVLEKITGEK